MQLSVNLLEGVTRLVVFEIHHNECLQFHLRFGLVIIRPLQV
jgi:hypothetical protein